MEIFYFILFYLLVMEKLFGELLYNQFPIVQPGYLSVSRPTDGDTLPLTYVNRYVVYPKVKQLHFELRSDQVLQVEGVIPLFLRHQLTFFNDELM